MLLFVGIADIFSIIAVVNTVTNRVMRLLGKDENVRWMNLTLYQGAPAKKGLTTAVSIAFCTFTFLKVGSGFLMLFHFDVSLGGSGIFESIVGRKRRARSNTGLYGLQKTAVLHVHSIRT